MARDNWIILVSALGVYALALIGAIGFAIILKLDMTTALILVGVVAITALFGTALPVARLVRERLKER